LLVDCLEDGFLAFEDFVVLFLEFGDLLHDDLIEVAGLVFSVARDEWDGAILGEQLQGVLDILCRGSDVFEMNSMLVMTMLLLKTAALPRMAAQSLFYKKT
jgi:hypothetical protein